MYNKYNYSVLSFFFLVLLLPFIGIFSKINYSVEDAHDYSSKPLINTKSLDMSFSGLKTAVLKVSKEIKTKKNPKCRVCSTKN